MTAAPRYNPNHKEELFALLKADDLYKWTEHTSRDGMLLEQWVQENVLHAMEECPRVLQYWKKAKSEHVSEHILHRHIGAALESLDDAEKVRILQGGYTTEAEASLYSFLREKQTHWSAVSPSWIGPQASDLRQTVLAAGWTPVRLMSQVGPGIQRPDAERWSEWVPYAHSIVVLNRGMRMRWEEKNGNAVPLAPIDATSQAWASPQDVALAKSLVEQMGPGMAYTLKAHPSLAPIDDALQKRMDGLVQVHAGLGMLFPLQQAIVQGKLPGMETEMHVALPELGMQ